MTQPAPQDQAAQLLDEMLRGAEMEVDVDHLEDVDLELLSAYAEGNVTPAERERCEEILAGNPNALDLVADLWSSRERRPIQIRHRSDSGVPRAIWCSLAASLLAALAAGGWALSQARTAHDLRERLASVGGQLHKSQRRLNLLTKERFLAQAPSPFRSYWMGDVTADILQLPEHRGERELTTEAAAREAEAQEYLESLVEEPQQAGYANLELATVEIAAGRLPEADDYLTKARKLLVDDPAVDNLRAVWHLAHLDSDSREQGEAMLKQITKEYADFTPSWYNLAFYLQQSGRDEESCAAWHEYLRHETRLGYRRAGELRLESIKVSHGGSPP